MCHSDTAWVTRQRPTTTIARYQRLGLTEQVVHCWARLAPSEVPQVMAAGAPKEIARDESRAASCPTARFEELDIRHVYIRPRTPHLNGKVERSHRVDDQEFYQLLDKDGITDDIHLFNEKLREWEDYYNYHRPHGALAGQTPYERLLAKARGGTSPAS
jgi:Integrase core domain